MSVTFEDKYRVVKELFNEYGVDHVEITDKKLKVTRRHYREIAGDVPQPVIVNVINRNTVSIQLNTSIDKILEEVKQAYDSKKYREAKRHLNQIAKELGNTAPDKNVLKKGVEWAARFGEKVFWQLLPLIIQHYGKLGI